MCPSSASSPYTGLFVLAIVLGMQVQGEEHGAALDDEDQQQPVKELQPDLGHEAGVGGDQVQKAKEGRKSQRSLRHVAQGRHGLFREPKLVQAVGHGSDSHYRQLGREQVKEPGFLAHHYVLEGRGVVLADRLEVPVAYKRLQEEKSKAPDEAPVPHPVVVLPVALSGAPEVAKARPPSHHKARKRYG